MKIQKCGDKYKIIYPSLFDYDSEWTWLNHKLNETDDLVLLWDGLKGLRELLDGTFKSKVTETVTGEVYILVTFTELKQFLLGFRDLLHLNS